MSKKIFKNIFHSGLTSLITGIIGFLMLPYMISKVGIVEYGLVGIGSIFYISGYISLLEMGFQASISKYISEFNAKQEYLKVCQLLNTTLIIFICLGFALMIIGVLISGFLVNYLLLIPSEYKSSFHKILLLISITYIFQFPIFVYAGLFEGLQRFDILKGIQSLCAVLTALCIILSLTLGYNYMGIIVSSLLVIFLQFLAYMYFSFRTLPYFSLSYKYINFNIIREIWRMTKFISIGKISSFLYNNSPRIFISILLGPVSMTSYEVIMRLPRFIKVSLGFFNSAIMPAVSEMEATNQQEKLPILFLRGNRYLMIIIVPIVSAAIYFADEFLRVWLGNGFSHLYLLLQFVLIWNIAIPLISYGGSIMLGLNRKLRETTILSIASTILSVVLSMILIWRYEISGIIIGYVCGILLVTPFYMSIYLKEFNIKYVDFIKMILSIFAFSIIPIGISILTNLIIVKESMLIFIMNIFVWCISYWMCLYFFSMDEDERMSINKIFTQGFNQNAGSV